MGAGGQGQNFFCSPVEGGQIFSHELRGGAETKFTAPDHGEKW